jgi:threonine synthase
LAAGALPFTVQGSDNGLTIEGGSTLGWEMIDAPAGAALDRFFVQVGGGALASACIQAFADARQLGHLARLPRIHAVQTAGGFPLVRAYDRVADRILTRCAAAGRQSNSFQPDTSRATRAATMAHEASPDLIEQEMTYARHHRSAFMWPWESPPHSLAGGILDDETYDWAVIVEGMLQTGGYPVVVSEAQIARANDIARAATGIDVDHTGSAGLAGLLAVLDVDPGIRDDQVAVIFSGVRR